MRVMYVIPSMGRGGAEVLLANQVPFLIKEGVEPIIVTKRGNDQLIRDHKLPVKHISLGLKSVTGPISALCRSVQLTRRLRKIIRQIKPDLVHLNLYTSDAWGRLAARGLSKTVTTWHSTGQWMIDKSLRKKVILYLDRWTINWPDAHVIAVSKAVSKWCCQYLQVSESKVQVIYNGIDLRRFVDQMPTRSNKPLRMVMVGRFFKPKAHDITLQALKKLRDSGTDFVVDFLGDGPLFQEMKDLAKELGLSNLVNFPGVCRDVPSILPQYDIFLMPSRHEGLPIAALEAMASYLPAVVSSVSGLTEVFDHEKNSLMVPPEDPSALAQAIMRLAGDDKLRENLALEARRTVEEKFNLAVQVPEMVEYYRRICS